MRKRSSRKRATAQEVGLRDDVVLEPPPVRRIGLGSEQVATWLRCHVTRFAFGGVPQRLVIDNLKAGIIRACCDDPQVNAPTANARNTTAF